MLWLFTIFTFFKPLDPDSEDPWIRIRNTDRTNVKGEKGEKSRTWVKKNIIPDPQHCLTKLDSQGVARGVPKNKAKVMSKSKVRRHLYTFLGEGLSVNPEFYSIK